MAKIVQRIPIYPLPSFSSLDVLHNHRRDIKTKSSDTILISPVSPENFSVSGSNSGSYIAFNCHVSLSHFKASLVPQPCSPFMTLILFEDCLGYFIDCSSVSLCWCFLVITVRFCITWSDTTQACPLCIISEVSLWPFIIDGDVNLG